ncbi:hypothetical protein [Actinopolymorpha cephalotaxi]|uniref:Uncharacterized protein n=1 Tax=Actinopolymorpha cephalotaxi TaxID=504797 RepID=A0ABX2S6Z2_9ACTN|nr:hypothetical protein [Actinopolymorpha cephalotaxi]NYH85386.1 hypothetical protein [Actinopolymorpha cephalotaxi]
MKRLATNPSPTGRRTSRAEVYSKEIASCEGEEMVTIFAAHPGQIVVEDEEPATA